jgi:hypothetical protein
MSLFDEESLHTNERKRNKQKIKEIAGKWRAQLSVFENGVAWPCAVVRGVTIRIV